MQDWQCMQRAHRFQEGSDERVGRDHCGKYVLGSKVFGVLIGANRYMTSGVG